MSKVAIYKQAKDINNLEENHYYKLVPRGEVHREQSQEGRKEDNLKIRKGSINIQMTNLFT